MPNLSRSLAIIYVLTKNIMMLAIFLILFHFIVGTIFVVSGESMEPNFHTGQYVYVNKLIYRIAQPARGNIVVIKFPGDLSKKKFIKRLVGLPGEKVNFSGNQIFINGKELIESYVSLEYASPADYKKQFILGRDEYLLIGDNRAESHDSRIWGPAHKKDIIGKATSILFPFKQIQSIAKPFY